MYNMVVIDLYIIHKYRELYFFPYIDKERESIIVIKQRDLKD